jgi:general secretion pathway protein K
MTRARRRNPAAGGRREGVALMLALVFVVLMAAIVVEFYFDAQVDASLAISRDAQFEAYVAAKSAVAEGMALLAADLLQSMGAGQQQAGQPVQLAPPGEYDSYWDAVPWAGGAPMKPMNDAMMRTTVSDEYGKINLNALLVPDENGTLTENEWLVQALRIFFQLRDPELGVDPVDAILDWLDYGDSDEERPEGAERDYYAGLEIPYPCKNGPMDSVEELLLIPGITPELYYGKPKEVQKAAEQKDAPPVLPLTAYLTVHGDWQGRVNVNTAEYDTLLAVLTAYQQTQPGSSYDPQLVTDQIFEYQFNEQPITNLNELRQIMPVQTAPVQHQPQRQVLQPGFGAKQARQVAPPVQQPGAGRDEAAAGGAEAIFRVNSFVFRIHGDGMMDDTLVRIEAVVWRSPFDPGDTEGGGATDPFRILAWKVIQ